MSGIHPDLRRVLDRALQESSVDFVVTEGLRTMERQRELVRIGASTTLKSRHLTGHAVDLYAWVDVNSDGRVVFEEMANVRLLTKIAEAIKLAGSELRIPVEWGGDWRKFKDYPHFQLSWKAYP